MRLSGSLLKWLPSIWCTSSSARSSRPSFFSKKPLCTVITFENNYYLSTSCSGGVNANSFMGCQKLPKEMWDSAAELLGSPYVLDAANINDGYPVFEWQSKPYQFKGSGTAEDPYLISSKKELEKMRDLINSEYFANKYNKCYYAQTADIDLGNELWTPIGIRLMNGEEAGLSFCGMKRNLIENGGGSQNTVGISLNETEVTLTLAGSESKLQLVATVVPDSSSTRL